MKLALGLYRSPLSDENFQLAGMAFAFSNMKAALQLAERRSSRAATVYTS